jgi:phosphoribosylformimino-5-aminoimidazole carboxamide ribotide isomerase
MTNRPFQVIPVLDLRAGTAVHAVAGQRAHYQPVRSILHATSDPLALAVALRERLGLNVLYLADLDAIAGLVPSVALYRDLISSGFHLIVDAGVRDLKCALKLSVLDPESRTIVAGLESLDGPDALREIVHVFGDQRTIFSLDLDDGCPRKRAHSAWKSGDPLELACEAIEHGVSHLLLLDLARVGTGRGSGTKGLIAQIHARHPGVKVSVGGGISGASEVIELRNAGAAAVLVASALHDGRIGRQELIGLEGAVSDKPVH